MREFINTITTTLVVIDGKSVKKLCQNSVLILRTLIQLSIIKKFEIASPTVYKHF